MNIHSAHTHARTQTLCAVVLTTLRIDSLSALTSVATVLKNCRHTVDTDAIRIRKYQQHEYNNESCDVNLYIH